MDLTLRDILNKVKSGEMQPDEAQWEIVKLVNIDQNSTEENKQENNWRNIKDFQPVWYHNVIVKLKTGEEVICYYGYCEKIEDGVFVNNATQTVYHKNEIEKWTYWYGQKNK